MTGSLGLLTVFSLRTFVYIRLYAGVYIYIYTLSLFSYLSILPFLTPDSRFAFFVIPARVCSVGGFRGGVMPFSRMRR